MGAGLSTAVIVSQSLAAAAALPSSYSSPLNFFANGPGFTSQDIATYNADIAGCMEARGWKYYPNPDALKLAAPAKVTDLVRYRMQYGYGGPPVPQVTSANDPNLAYAESLSHADQVRYATDLGGSDQEGAPQDGSPYGCEPVAMEAIRKGLPGFDDAGFAAQWSASVQAVLGDSKYQAALVAWRSCMLSSGYVAQDPGKPGSGAVPGSSTTTTAGAPVASTREADVDMWCEIRDYLPVKQRLEIAQIKSLTAQFPQYESRAEAILAGSSVVP